MQKIQKVEYSGTLVLTTQQIAEAYGTSADTITKNFNRNKDRYIDGKHFIRLKGEELRNFKANGQIDLLPSVNTLYLWTKKGAFLHAKSLNTDTAWEVYDRLVDNYFEKQQPKIPMTATEQIKLLAQGNVELNQKVDNLEERFTRFEMDLPLLPDEADEIHDTLNKRVVYLLGGGQSNAYADKSLAKKVFMDAYRELKRNFNVNRYKAIKRNQKARALEIISEYKPPVFLADAIDNANAQQNLFGEVTE